MIEFIYSTSRHEKPKKLSKYKKGSWINVVNPSQSELVALAKNLKLKSSILLDVLDEDEMPRRERDGQTNYIFTRFVEVDHNLEAQTIVILIIVSKDKFITISRRPLPNLEEDLLGYAKLDTKQPTNMLLDLMEYIAGTYDKQLKKVTRQVRSIRQRLRVENISNEDFVNFVIIEEELNDFLTVLTPTTSSLKRLQTSTSFKLSKTQSEVIEDLLLKTEQSIAESQSILTGIVNIREAYSTIATNNLNRIIRILTVLTTVLAVPTLIASLYGMNVGLPLSGEDDAFLIIVLISVAISFSLLLYFRLKKWL